MKMFMAVPAAGCLSSSRKRASARCASPARASASVAKALCRTEFGDSRRDRSATFRLRVPGTAWAGRQSPPVESG